MQASKATECFGPQPREARETGVTARFVRLPPVDFLKEGVEVIGEFLKVGNCGAQPLHSAKKYLKLTACRRTLHVGEAVQLCRIVADPCSRDDTPTPTGLCHIEVGVGRV